MLGQRVQGVQENWGVMPSLDFAILAVAATEDGETFNLLGAGVEEIRVARLPIVSRLYLAARWEWETSDPGPLATAGVTCRCLEGDAVVLYENTFEARVRAQEGVVLPARLKTALPLKIDRYGRHIVELTVRRQVLKAIPFAVVPQQA